MTLSRTQSWLALVVALLALCSLNLVVRALVARRNAQLSIREVVYASPDGNDLHLELHLPPTAIRPPRVVMYIHGGGWKAGSYKEAAAFASMFTDQGLALASVEYRFTSVAPFPAQIHDCKAAVRYLRAHASDLGIDASRIGIFGGSAGGHLAALLGVSADVPLLEGTLGNSEQSSRVQAVVDWYGPTDLPHAMADLDSIKAPPEMKKAVEDLLVSLAGGPLESKQEQLRTASPIEYITRDDAPILIYHGTVDPIVPYCQSTRFLDALRAKGVPAELITMTGKGHEAFKGPELDRIPKYFRHHLQKN